MALTDTITPQWLKDRFLFGIDLTGDGGDTDPFPDALFQHAIKAAISVLESEFDIFIDSKIITNERHDRLDWEGWRVVPVDVDCTPLQSIQKLQIRWGQTPDPVDLPLSWANIASKGAGQISIIPDSVSAATTSFEVQSFYNSIWLRGYAPLYWSVDYTAGYATADDVPHVLLDCIGLIASMLPMDTAGDLIAGAGIASISTSLDGISTSINTTSSATNSGYGARVKSYEARLKRQMDVCRRTFRSIGADGL